MQRNGLLQRSHRGLRARHAGRGFPGDLGDAVVSSASRRVMQANGLRGRSLIDIAARRAVELTRCKQSNEGAKGTANEETREAGRAAAGQSA